jgi:hypothetical protein
MRRKTKSRRNWKNRSKRQSRTTKRVIKKEMKTKKSKQMRNN